MTHLYRIHTCGQLTLQNAGQSTRLSGWIHRKRDHGQLLFIDLRDHYGITQCVVESHKDAFGILDRASTAWPLPMVWGGG